MAVTHDTHANKSLVRRYIEEVWDHQKNHNMASKMAVADELLDDSFKVRGAPYRDKAGEKDFVQKHHHAYPDMDPEVDFVTLLGQAGTGKTLLTLAAGLMKTLMMDAET